MKRDQIHDYYFLKAKKENYSARSVYKLQEIQSKYKVIKAGDRVLDLGCAPGSWSEFTAEILGPEGTLCGIDLLPLSPNARERIKRSKVKLQFYQGSILEQNPFSELKFDCIISDMAPNTKGNRLVDTQGSLGLIEMAFQIAQKQLRPDGHFIVKLFQSNDTMDITRDWKKHFKIAKLAKPAAVRKESKELYFVGIGFSLD
jgi:23S rRNA (uridine2552-2'-O)-methyltransferase